jgi:hypothetical protein
MQLRLHLVPCGVLFYDAMDDTPFAATEEEESTVMKNVLYFLIAAMLLAATCGCNSCGNNRRSWFSGWFNRGDSCQTCADGAIVDGPATLGTPILNNVPASPRASGFENLPSPLPIQ